MQRRDFFRSLLGAGAAAAVAPVVVPHAEAAAGLPFATEFTQLLNYATLAAQLGQQIAMVTNQIQQIYLAITAGTLLLNPAMITNIAQVLASLSQNVQQGLGLSIILGNLDVMFRQVYSGMANPALPFQPQYQAWGQTTLDTISGILNSIGVHMQDMTNDTVIMNWLDGQNSSAIGTTQAIQAGVQVAEFQTQQLQKLRQIMLNQLNATSIIEGRKANNEMVISQLTDNQFQPMVYVAGN